MHSRRLPGLGLVLSQNAQGMFCYCALVLYVVLNVTQAAQIFCYIHIILALLLKQTVMLGGASVWLLDFRLSCCGFDSQLWHYQVT